VALGDAANSWVAGHLPDQIEIYRDQSRLSPKARGGRRRLAPRVPGSDHDYIKTLVKHSLLTRSSYTYAAELLCGYQNHSS
jgi:hypothetical protein